MGSRGREVVQKRKLIEVALPLEAINLASSAEKRRKRGKPQQIHQYWARRPITAARALLFAQVVDDPSSRPDRFPTEQDQREERARLHRLIADLAQWDAAWDVDLLKVARAEIIASVGEVPTIVDPFAGGGSIPLEAQRLGLGVDASDLNPVAVLINEALVRIPEQFRDTPPVWPGLAESRLIWRGLDGLAADVAAYGEWMRTEAEARLRDLYPSAGGREVIAWVWARTVVCSNPACGIIAPLVSSWWLSKKKGAETWIVPSVHHDASQPSLKIVRFAVQTGAGDGPTVGTMRRNHAECVACGATIPKDYIKKMGHDGHIGATLMAVVAEGDRKRIYLSPDEVHRQAARVAAPEEVPRGRLSQNSQYMGPPLYGMTTVADLFTQRQLVALTTFTELVEEARARIAKDGAPDAYAEGVGIYLSLAVSRLADWSSSLCRWESTAQVSQQTFGQQTLSMTWDFSESRTTGAKSAGSFGACVKTVTSAIALLTGGAPASVRQADAATRDYRGLVISTDPPYYDNVPYADLSDFFYSWMRLCLREARPDLFGTLLVPKAEELVASPLRHGGRAGAQEFFEAGFRRVFAKAREAASSDYPIAVWYAFRQSDSDDQGEASTGWETLLEGMIREGWEITSTWPIASEHEARVRGQNSNALASSIVLTLRPRADGSPTTDRRGFIAALGSELPSALRSLQQGQIAPVDLPQAAIGPGMAVYSRYSAVLEPDGKKMTVRSALSRINEILDQVLNEQEGDFDSTSRFAIAWYRQHGYGVGKFGDADNLARARNTSVDSMDRDEILTSRAGNVQLFKPTELSWDYNVRNDSHTSNWEALHHLIKVLERDGIAPAGDFMHAAMTRPDEAVDPDLVKELAHLLFRIAEGNGWTKDALSFNTLVTSWPEILEVARSVKKPPVSQGAFDFDEGDGS